MIRVSTYDTRNSPGITQTMKFQYASDLHFELIKNREALGIESLIPSADILILAGDISVLKKDSVKFLEYFNYFSKNWKKTYIIPGNHEF